jgi:hypothetical protein
MLLAGGWDFAAAAGADPLLLGGLLGLIGKSDDEG